MSASQRRFAVLLARALFCGALFVELVALHFPTPSGVASDPEAEEAVRGAWSLAGRVAGRVGEMAPTGLVELLSPLLADKTVHFAVFLPLGLLWALERRLSGRLDRRTGMLGMLGLTAYAALGEASQVVGGRYPDPGDFVANVAGALVGMGLVVLWGRLRERSAQSVMAS